MEGVVLSSSLYDPGWVFLGSSILEYCLQLTEPTQSSPTRPQQQQGSSDDQQQQPSNGPNSSSPSPLLRPTQTQSSYSLLCAPQAPTVDSNLTCGEERTASPEADDLEAGVPALMSKR